MQLRHNHSYIYFLTNILSLKFIAVFILSPNIFPLIYCVINAEAIVLSLKDLPLNCCVIPTAMCGQGSSVGVVTDYRLDGLGSNPGGDEIFRLSIPVLGPTQPPVKWVPGLSRGLKCGRGMLLTTHPLLVPRLWKSRAIPLPTLWATPGL
jgi:hypothetical protein